MAGMRYIRLGSTGMRVSRVCLGMMTFGDTATRKWHLREEAAEPIVSSMILRKPKALVANQAAARVRKPSTPRAGFVGN